MSECERASYVSPTTRFSLQSSLTDWLALMFVFHAYMCHVYSCNFCIISRCTYVHTIAEQSGSAFLHKICSYLPDRTQVYLIAQNSRKIGVYGLLTYDFVTTSNDVTCFPRNMGLNFWSLFSDYKGMAMTLTQNGRKLPVELSTMAYECCKHPKISQLTNSPMYERWTHLCVPRKSYKRFNAYRHTIWACWKTKLHAFSLSKKKLKSKLLRHMYCDECVVLNFVYLRLTTNFTGIICCAF